MGFPIRKSPDQSLFSNSPKLIAANHVLHRRPPPRHPPHTLSSLTKLVILESGLLERNPDQGHSFESLTLEILHSLEIVFVFADRMQLSKNTFKIRMNRILLKQEDVSSILLLHPLFRAENQ